MEQAMEADLGSMSNSKFQVLVCSQSLKFNASHFIAYKGFREKLHGHNYICGLRLHGRRGGDGYVIDFGDMKKVLKQICGTFNEHVIIPMKSDVLQITTNQSGNLEIVCEDGSFFSFPEKDCIKLDIVHSSAEELAELILNKVLEAFPPDFLCKTRGIAEIEVSVSEAPGQTAFCSRKI